jgi:hypothetical protein
LLIKIFFSVTRAFLKSIVILNLSNVITLLDCIVMTMSEEIQDLKHKLRSEFDQTTTFYFEKIIDFLKWTTTIALGALLWIGINYHSIGNITWINTSLACFGLSIMSSFAYVIFILNWMNDTSRLTIDHHEWISKIIPDMPISEEIGIKMGEIATKLIEEPQKLSFFLNKMKYLIIFHGVCLIAGTLSFLLAIIFK